MAVTTSIPEFVLPDDSSSGRENVAASFDPIALLSDGKQSGLFSRTARLDDGLRIEPDADAGKSGNKYRIERDDAGRPTKVSDSNGNLLRTIEYDGNGNVRQVKLEKATTVYEDDGRSRQEPAYLRPGKDGKSWEWFDKNGENTSKGFGRFTVDNDGSIIFENSIGDRTKLEPDGSEEYIRSTRKDWPERATETTVVPTDNGFIVKDKDGTPLRTIVKDEKGILSVEEADGSRWIRSADGKSWDRFWNGIAYGGTAYNLQVDETGNISYEQNEGGYRTPFLPDGRRQRVFEWIDGRVRYEPK